METVRGWFTGIWASTTPKYEDVLQREAKTMDWYRDGADDVYVRSIGPTRLARSQSHVIY